MIALLQVAGRGPVDVTDMILRGNLSTQLILAITALFSLLSWIIIVWKLAQFRRVRRQGLRFLSTVERTERLEDVYKGVMRLPESPYVAVFRQGMTFFAELRPGALRPDAPPSAGLSEAQHGLVDVLQPLRLLHRVQEARALPPHPAQLRQLPDDDDPAQQREQRGDDEDDLRGRVAMQDHVGDFNGAAPRLEQCRHALERPAMYS